ENWKFCHPFAMTLLALAGVSLLFLRGAARGLSRTYDDAQWLERKRYFTIRGGRPQWISSEAALASRPAPATVRDKRLAAARNIWEMPLAQLVKFKNPILQREVRGKLRMRRYPRPVTIIMGTLALFGVFAYVFGFLWAIYES